MLANTHYASACEWYLCLSNDVCDVVWWSSMAFCHVLGNIIVFFSSWYGAWQGIISGLSLVVVSFFFFLFFSLFKRKCIFVLFYFCFSICTLRFFITYFCPLSFKKKYVFDLVFKLQFVIFFQFAPYSFFYIFFSWLFC